MTDFHSHILPGIDDGSQSVEESIQMLTALREQGVKTVCATPHFYAEENSPRRFFDKRHRASEKLFSAIEGMDLPKILLGAEVTYYPGVSRMSRLDDFKLEGTQLILLEMPMMKWSDYTLSEVIDLSCSGDRKVVLAHIERCRPFQDKNVWGRLLDSDVIMQSNASYFAERRTRRKALSALKNGEIHIIGSDCHNMTTRAPRIREALQIIEKKIGNEAVQYLAQNGEQLIGTVSNQAKETEKI